MEKRKKLIWFNVAFWLGSLWVILSVFALLWVQNIKEKNTGVDAITQTEAGTYFLTTGSTLYTLDNQENISLYTPLKALGVAGKVSDIEAISENRILIADTNEGTLKLCSPWISKCEYFLNRHDQTKYLYRGDFSFALDRKAQRLYVEEHATHQLDTYTLSGQYLNSTHSESRWFSMRRWLAYLDAVLHITQPASPASADFFIKTYGSMDNLVGDTQLVNASMQWPVIVQKTADHRLWVKGDAEKTINYLRHRSINKHSSSQKKASSLLDVEPLNDYFVLFEKEKFSLLSIGYEGEILGSFGGVKLQEVLARLETKQASLHKLSRFMLGEVLLSMLVIVFFNYYRKKYRKLVVHTWTQKLVGNDFSIKDQKKIKTTEALPFERMPSNILWIKPMQQRHIHAERLFMFLKVCIIACTGVALFSEYAQAGLDNITLLTLMAGLLLLTHLAYFYFVIQQNINGEIGTDGDNIWLRDHLGKTVMAHPDEVSFTDRAISAEGITVVISDNGEYGGKDQLFPMDKLMRHIYPMLASANKISPLKMGISMILSRHPKVWPPVSSTLSGLGALGVLGAINLSSGLFILI